MMRLRLKERRCSRWAAWGAGLLLAWTVASTAAAQPFRLREGWIPYFDARTGLNVYGGERRDSYDSKLDEFFDVGGAGIGLEAGLVLSPRWSAGVFLLASRYPGLIYINGPQFRTQIRPGRSMDWIHTLGAVGRLHFPAHGLVTPYLLGGGGLSFTMLNKHIYVGIGPRIGIGADVQMSENLGLFAEIDQMLVVPGNAMDLTGPGRDYDPFSFLGFGVRYRLRDAVAANNRPVFIFGLYGPGTLQAGEEGLFAADLRFDDSAQYLSFAWDFGDGTRSDHMAARHRYLDPGTYTATFVVTDGIWTERRTVKTVVQERVQPVEIVSVRSNPLVLRVGEPVSFSTYLRGTEPITCRWDFGDGGRAEGCEATHRFMVAGAYPVVLEASNARGAVTSRREVTVRENPCMDLTRLNAVYFSQHESTLDIDARGFLRENIARLIECPAVKLELRGFAEPSERGGARLAQERAQAARQYYINLGVPASRIEMAEAGQVVRPPAGEAVWQYRSVESVPKHE